LNHSKDPSPSFQGKIKVVLSAPWYKPECDECNNFKIFKLSRGTGAICEKVEAEEPCIIGEINDKT